MSHRLDAEEESGKVPVDLKFIIAIASIIFTAGGGWAILHAQETKVEKLELSDANHGTKITHIEDTVDHIATEQREMKLEQQAQRTEQIKQGNVLTEILTELRSVVRANP